MTDHTFSTPRPVDLFAEIGRGSVEVHATETDHTDITISGRDAEQVIVRQDGRRISVIGPRQRGIIFGPDARLDVRITLPTRSDVAVRTGSAAIGVAGTVGAAQLKSGSGDVRVGVADGPAVVETGSGDIHLDAVHGALRAKSGSGDVVVGDAAKVASISTGSGDVRISASNGQTVVKTGSGDLEIGESTDDVTLSTGSGDLVVARAHRGRVTAKGASGDIRIGIPAGVPVWTDIVTVSGEIRSNLVSVGKPGEGADHVEVRTRTVSGDVVLAQA